MKNISFPRVVAVILAITIVAPTAFFVAPQRATAQVQLSFDAAALVESAINVAKTTISAVADKASAAAEYALYIQQYVLEPLAFTLSGNLIRSITGGIVKFVNGDTNGTGQSQFVRNLQGYQQTLGDSQANAFFFQFGKNSNSPFAQNINSSLRANYLQQTSLAGFFAGNRNTLPGYTRNQDAYLAGNWSQGGAGAWLALTTQDQNNPYILHRNAQYELARMVQDKTAAGLNEYVAGSGFISWCGGSVADNADQLPAGTPGSSREGPVNPDLIPAGTEGSTQVGPAAPDGTNKAATAPGAPCTNKDGTPGTIQTPGSVIKGVLDKALGLNADKATNMGNISANITKLLGSLSTVINTATFATQLIGGANTADISGGLAGSTKPLIGSDRGSFIDQYQNTSGYYGVTESDVSQNTANSPASSSKQLVENTDQYDAAWAVINGAATDANNSVTLLLNACSATGNTILTTTARNALAGLVTPVLSKVANASTTIAKARDLVDRIQTEAGSKAPGAGGQYAADVQLLQTYPPTGTDIAYAEKQAGEGAAAVSKPEGWLTISGGTLVTQMHLAAANAYKLRQQCVGGSTATTTTP